MSHTPSRAVPRPPGPPERKSTGLAPDPLWYQDAVIYEVHVRAFQDSSGDGIGDFRGLTSRLDYLADLGVTAIWLLPFYPSPLRDDGYDIADYTRVHPDYGSLRDVRSFIREAHQRDLRVITELVFNHTSDQHPWFQRARRARPGSPERDWYVWSDTPERYRRRAHHLQGLRDQQLELGPGRGGLLLAPLLQPPAGPQLRRAAGRGGPAAGHRLLARGRRRRPAPRRHPVPLRARRHQRREPARDARAS